MQSSTTPLTAADSTLGAIHLRYLRLLRENGHFRRVWLAQLVSETGDWFYSLAVYDLLLNLTGSGKAVAYAIILQTLPWFFMTPLAGHLADRFARRRLMLLADIVRAFIVLGLLLVHTREGVPLVYVLLGAEVFFASFFEPARSALLPDLVTGNELLAANSLSAASWSVALAFGAAGGGFVAVWLGRRAVFIADSLSFLIAAWLIRGVRVRESHIESRETSEGAMRGAAAMTFPQYLRGQPKVAVLPLAKTGLGLLGGSLLLLTVFGERVFPGSEQGPLAMGLLYAARGVGATLGPIVGAILIRGRERRMWRSISLCFFLMGASYLALSRAPTLLLGAIAVLIAHSASSNVWVSSTTLLQLHADDRFRGRVFALDSGLIGLTIALSNYLVGVGLDTGRLSARELAVALGILLLLPGILWLPVQAVWGRARRA